MKRSLTYRILLYSAITVLSALVLTPSVAEWTGKTHKLPYWFLKAFPYRIALGLDLKGGYRWEYSVKLTKAVLNNLDLAATQLEDQLKTAKAKQVVVKRVGETQYAELQIVAENPADLKKIDNQLVRKLNLVESKRTGNTINYKVDPQYLGQFETGVLTKNIQKIKERIDKFGVTEPTVQRHRNNIVVEVAGVSKEARKRIEDMIGRTAQLEFKLVDNDPALLKKVADLAASKKAEKGEFAALEAIDASREGIQGQVVTASDDKILQRFVEWANALPEGQRLPPDRELVYGQTTSTSEQDKIYRTYIVTKKPALTGDYLLKAESSSCRVEGSAIEERAPCVAISLNGTGSTLFEKVTKENIGKQLAVILDNEVYSAPNLKNAISGGEAVITLGQKTEGIDVLQKRAQDLVTTLRAGALPAPLKQERLNGVEASLGKETVHKAWVAMLVGSLAVVLFMLLYYRKAGLIANFAMILNLLFLLSLLALVGTTLTLPGIAAVVLTVGMAVDANIIIYERIREELRAGKSPRSAVDAGFKRAFWTVFDAHVTNLVAGVVLYSYGTGPIRGFAVSLMAGIVCNLFTSVWLSRAIFEWSVGKKATKLSI